MAILDIPSRATDRNSATFEKATIFGCTHGFSFWQNFDESDTFY